MSDVRDRLADSSYKRYLGYLVSTPTDLNLALDIIDRLYWTQCPKPKIYQKTVKDLTTEIFKTNTLENNQICRIEIYKLFNLGYLFKHQYKKRYKYTVSLTQKGINFLEYETSDKDKKLELKIEWGAWYCSNELEIKNFIIKELNIKYE